MSIVTKDGDGGLTSLYRNTKRVCKDDPRIEACGTLDELCAVLSLARNLVKSKSEKSFFFSIQKDISGMCAELSSAGNGNKILRGIGKDAVNRLEDGIYKLESKNVFQSGCFCVGSASHISSVMDIARTVARRAERRIITVWKKYPISGSLIPVYINRLSDLLFLIARSHERGKR